MNENPDFIRQLSSGLWSVRVNGFAHNPEYETVHMAYYAYCKDDRSPGFSFVQEKGIELKCDRCGYDGSGTYLHVSHNVSYCSTCQQELLTFLMECYMEGNNNEV